MSYSLNLSGHTADPEAAGAVEALVRAFAAKLRKTPAAGLGSLTWNGEDLLAGRGTVENPILQERPAKLTPEEKRDAIVAAGAPNPEAFSDDAAGAAHYAASVALYDQAKAEVDALATAGGESDG